MIFFIADLHFGHEHCLEFDNRPFQTIEQHDNMIIMNWNNKVNIDDDVYILGDLSWYNSTKTIEIIKSLNGNKHLIIGNHDNKILKNSYFRSLFVEICNYKELYINESTSVVLCHYPIPCFKNHYYNWYHFYGHVHKSFEDNMMNYIRDSMMALYDTPCNMLNVGCMQPYMNYKPMSFEELKNIIDKITKKE